MAPKGLLFSPDAEPDWDAEARRYRNTLLGVTHVQARVSQQVVEQLRREPGGRQERPGHPLPGQVLRPGC